MTKAPDNFCQCVLEQYSPSPNILIKDHSAQKYKAAQLQGAAAARLRNRALPVKSWLCCFNFLWLKRDYNIPVFLEQGMCQARKDNYNNWQKRRNITQWQELTRGIHCPPSSDKLNCKSKAWQHSPNIKQEVRGKEWRNSKKSAGPKRQFALFPKEMLWHASDHRQPSSVKWLWIGARGQQEDRATRLLDQNRVSVAGRADVLFWKPSRRLSQPGPTASHVLLTEASMNYYISFCYLSSWFITDRQLSFKRSTTLRGPPRCPQKEGVREWGRV